LPKYFASEQHYAAKPPPSLDNHPSWLEQQQPLPFAPGIQCDNTQLSDRIKSNLELLRQFQLEKFTADRDSLSRKSANYYPESDEKEIPFDLLKRDGMRSGRRGWTAKAETLEVETSKAETSKALNVKTLKTLKTMKMEASSKGAKAEALVREAEISEREANIKTTTSIATTSIPNKMTCYRCWKLHGDRKSLIPHLQLCKGKCQGCKELGVPCIFLNGMSKSCNSCKEQGVVCGGRTTHKHLESTRKVFYDTCRRYKRQMERSHLKRHMLQCKGKCKECSERGIPCIYSRAVLTCVNCTEHGLVCSGGRTTVKFTKKTCPRCEGQIGRNHSYTHQPRCMGKCKECSERGISSTYLCNTRISQTVLTCVNCTGHELSCSGRVTYKTEETCFRCEAVPAVSGDMFSSHETAAGANARIARKEIFLVSFGA